MTAGFDTPGAMTALSGIEIAAVRKEAPPGSSRLGELSLLDVVHALLPPYQRDGMPDPKCCQASIACMAPSEAGL